MDYFQTGPTGYGWIVVKSINPLKISIFCSLWCANRRNNQLYREKIKYHTEMILEFGEKCFKDIKLLYIEPIDSIISDIHLLFS